jgi:hypothetical protein
LNAPVSQALEPRRQLEIGARTAAGTNGAANTRLVAAQPVSVGGGGARSQQDEQQLPELRRGKAALHGATHRLRRRLAAAEAAHLRRRIPSCRTNGGGRCGCRR